MCLPIVAAGIAAVSAGLSAAGQMSAAHAQAKAINAQNDARQKQIDQATTAEINDRLREARRQQGRIDVAAGQSGLSLNSGGVEDLLLDAWTQASLSDERSLANRESQKLAAATQAQAAMPSGPTLLGAGLQIALAGAKGYADAKSGGK